MITLADKLFCLKRELGYRRFVYPRQVASGTMKQEKADREIAVMEAIVAEYQTQVDALPVPKPEADLFNR
jgi:hypothetical protein